MKKKKTTKRTVSERRRQILGISVTDETNQHAGRMRVDPSYGVTLSNLAIAEAMLIGRPGQDSAQPHFIAIVKEIERFYGIEFEEIQAAPKQD